MEIIKSAEESQTRGPICSYNYGCDTRMDAPSCPNFSCTCNNAVNGSCWFLNG